MKNSIRISLAALVLTILCSTTVQAQDEGYKTPPAALKALIDAPEAPSVSVSPDGSALLLMARESVPGIEELAQPELRIGGTRINPRNNGPSRSSYNTGIVISSIGSGVETPVTGVPIGGKIASVSWSPDGAHIGFTVSFENRIEMFLADAKTGQARRLIDSPINAVSGSAYTWLPGGKSLLVRIVSPKRGSMPVEPSVPSTPIIQENIGKTAPAVTYQDLLRTPYEEDLLEWMMASDVVNVSISGTETSLGLSGMVTSMSPSPDGKYILTETVHRPFSYLVPFYRFPTRIEVRDRTGAVVKMLTDLPLMEEVPTGSGSTTTGVRSIEWRQDRDATLAWVEALDGGDGNAKVDLRDALYQLESPFSGKAQELIRLPLRYGGVSWSDQGFALVNERWTSTRQTRTYIFNPDKPDYLSKVLFDRSYEDAYSNPGSVTTEVGPTGRRLIVTTDNGRAVYLTGAGASPEGNRPFLRKMNLSSGEVEELFRSEAPHYESVLGWINASTGVFLTSRESTSEPPNYYLRKVGSPSMTAITHFEHPYPEMDAITKEFITYTRADGVPLSATLYLPAGYDKGRDGPLPTLLWAYPREFKSAAAAGQVTESPYRFKRVSYSGAIPYVTQGYAVLDNAAMPIVGEGDEEPNDTFVEQLRTSAEAAINEGARRGVVDPDRVAVAGHSYGAFMTANLLAHTDLFRAGIARSGAYNRTLTPFGFQAEPRTFWESPEVYFAMSPFMHADKVNEPILLIHGMADNNTGTFPIQSERFYA
ncbi:MAG: prolyl oligopeptidase family serine peptidase, partial [Bacteroidetes bacterium]|nr:prolyl oligopeptidase family serine peptidase [Bacteroidota bacterium]